VGAAPCFPDLPRAFSEFRDRIALSVEDLLESTLSAEFFGIRYDTPNLVVQEVLGRSQQFQKPPLFLFDHAGYTIGAFNKLRVRVLHDFNNGPNHGMQARLLLPQKCRVADGTSYDLPKGIAAPEIVRPQAVRNQKCCRPRVVRNHSQGSRRLCAGFLFQFFRERRSGQLRSAFDQRGEQVRVVIRNHALKHCRRALQSHAGVDRRLR